MPERKGLRTADAVSIDKRANPSTKSHSGRFGHIYGVEICLVVDPPALCCPLNMALVVQAYASGSGPSVEDGR